MTKVLIVIGATTPRQAGRKVGSAEMQEADLVIGLNEECSGGEVLKDRFGKPTPVKVVS